MNEHLIMVNVKGASAPGALEVPAAILHTGNNPLPSPASKEWAMFAWSLLIVFAGLTAFASWVQLESLQSASITPRALAPTVSNPEPRPMVQPFSGSPSAKRGDLIVFEAPFLPQVQPVLAAASETVVVRKGQSIDGLFLMGPKSYVVSSNDYRTVVRAEKIRGTLASGTTPAQ